MPNSTPLVRTIPLRLMNRPPAQAGVIGNCAAWHCPCGHPIALQGRSGAVSGPTPDSVVTCPRCARTFFVIPLDRSHGPPIEVVELFAPSPSGPAPAPAPAPAPDSAAS